MKIKTSTLLMEAGVSYNKRKLHQAGYFRELLPSNPDIHARTASSAAAVTRDDSAARERKLPERMTSAGILFAVSVSFRRDVVRLVYFAGSRSNFAEPSS
jgi:hypothetical protein